MASIHILKADRTLKRFEIRKLPSRGVNFIKCVTVDGRILGMTKTGSLYGVQGLPTRQGACIGWTWAWLTDFAIALQRLGLISEDDRDTTISKHYEDCRTRDLSFSASQLERYAEEIGLRLTKHQQGKISQLKGNRV